MRIENKGELVFSGLLLALGIFILIATGFIRIPEAASNVGPRFMPYFAGALLTVAAGWALIEALRGKSVTPEENELTDPAERFNLPRVLLLLGSIVFFAGLLDMLGYFVVAPLSFFGLLYSFGARRWLTMILSSLVVPLVVFVLFAEVLGIDLPLGPFEGLWY